VGTLSANATGSNGVILADGAQGVQLSVWIRDTYGNPISGVTPQFTATNTNSTNSQTPCNQTNSSGLATCGLNSTYPETKTIALSSPTVSFSPLFIDFSGLKITDSNGTNLDHPDSFGSVPSGNHVSHSYLIYRPTTVVKTF
jgi:hypothetical protein